MWKVVLEVARGYMPWIERGLPSAALVVGLVALTVGVCARASVGGAEDTASRLSRDAEAARSDAAGVSAEMDTTRGYLTGLSQRLDAANDETKSVAASVATAGGDLEAARTALQASIDGLAAGQAALESNLTVTAASVTANRVAAGTLGSSQNALQKGLADLDESLATATADLDTVALRLDDLTSSFVLTRDDVKANMDATGVNAEAITALEAEQAASDLALTALQGDVATMIAKINTAKLYTAAADAYFGWKAAVAAATAQLGASPVVAAAENAMENSVGLTADPDLQDAYTDWRTAPLQHIAIRYEAEFLSLLGDRLTAALAPE